MMQKDSISSSQTISTMILFIFGSSVIMGVNSSAHQDSWIAILLACGMTLPAVLIYARTLHLFPGKGMYDIMETLLGNVVSKAFILLMTWYAIHLGSLVMCNFYEFIALIDLPQTPHFVIILPFIAVILYIAKSGMKILGNWSLITLPIVLLVVFFTIVFSLNAADFSNLLPVMDHSVAEISKASFSIFSFPFAELVLFMAILGCAKQGTSPYKVYIYSVLIGTLVLLLVLLRNTVLLGPELMESEYFPSYVASRIISVGDFLTRIEGTISVNFILAGITKITICILAAANGLAKLFGVKKPVHLIIPSCMLMLGISFTSYQSITQMFVFEEKYYSIYSIPFQIIIPFTIWIIAEIRTHRGTHQIRNKSV